MVYVYLFLVKQDHFRYLCGLPTTTMTSTTSTTKTITTTILCCMQILFLIKQDQLQSMIGQRNEIRILVEKLFGSL
jgi:hypothetical protein